MEAYIDSSVLLAILFNEPNKLNNLERYKKLFSSQLLRTECIRTIYRLKLENKLNDKKTAEIFSDLLSLFKSITMVQLTPSVLFGAEQFFPVTVGTLDAIHLSTALLLRREKGVQNFLTHDVQLSQAALSVGLLINK